MRQFTKILFLFIVTAIGLTVPSLATDTYDTIKEFKNNVFELIKSNNSEYLKEYLDNVPDCDYSQEPDAPILCTTDRNDGKDFFIHIWQRGFKQGKENNFIIVSLDATIYEALERLYRNLYHEEPTKLNVNNYKDFYNRFKTTWLADKVEKILIRIWQKGSFVNKYTNFDTMTGETIFNTLYLSNELKLNNIYKYVSSDIAINPSSANRKSKRLYSILRQMKYQAKKMNSQKLLNELLSSWFDSVVSPEEWDKTEQEYYKGKKQECMYKTLNETGWDLFAENTFVPTDWQKHAITLNAKACRRVLNRGKNLTDLEKSLNEKTCSEFENGAEKYGFYVSPKKVTEQHEKQFAEALNRRSDLLQKGYYNPELF